jgi:hypothetical protein
LDTKPTLHTDLDSDALEGILSRLIEQRTTAEMSAAAQTVKYRGPKTIDHIARQSRKKAEQLLADIRYNATNPDYEIDDPAQFLLGQYVQEELLRRYDNRRAGRDRGGDDMAVIRIGEGDSLDMCLVAGDRRVRQRVIHELAGDLQALDGNAGHVGDEIANPFVVNLICPPRIDQSVNGDLHDDVSQMEWIEDAGV